jgi:DNA-binding MarR family transcriptional regulator
MNLLLSQLHAARKRKLCNSALSTLLIIQDEPVALGRIAEILGLSVASTTGIADKLEKKFYVTRQPAPNDRRKRLLTITPQGQAALEAIQEL